MLSDERGIKEPVSYPQHLKTNCTLDGGEHRFHFRDGAQQISAAEALVKKRSRAAALITGLGRGFQGRREARLLRVFRHNAAAAVIQGRYRARAARRYVSVQGILLVGQKLLVHVLLYVWCNCI